MAGCLNALLEQESDLRLARTRRAGRQACILTRLCVCVFTVPPSALLGISEHRATYLRQGSRNVERAANRAEPRGYSVKSSEHRPSQAAGGCIGCAVRSVRSVTWC